MYVNRKLMLWLAVCALALPLLVAGNAFAIHASDGSKPNAAGGWDITDYGQCISGVRADGTMVVDTAHNLSRADCIDHVLSAISTTVPGDTNYNTAALCTATSGRANGDNVSHYTANVCVNLATGAGINLGDLDRTAGNCILKGGVMFSSCTGAWIYTNSGAAGASTPGNGGAGFCYTTIITGASTTGTIPAIDGGYNVQGSCPTTITGMVSSGTGSTYKCTFAQGIAGTANANVARKDGSGNTAAANTYVNLSGLTQGQCIYAGGAWSTGTIKSGETSFGSTTITTIATVENTRAGCLECHNTVSQNNTYAERWKEPYLMTGHKNMLRKVTAGQIWAGPDGVNYETTGWANGTLNFGTATATATAGTIFTDRPLLYIFGDWMAAAPAGLDVVVQMPTGAKYNGGSNYSCAPCHTTGWNNPSAGMCSLSTYTTSANCSGAGGTWYPSNGVEGASYTPAEPAASFPGVTFAGAGRWDRDGIQCSRCHYSVFSKTAPAPAGTSAHNVTPASNANQQVNNICFGCHQGIAKANNGASTNNDLANPASKIPVKNTVTAPAYVPEFNGHVIGNQFLNSPHSRYSVTTGNGIVPNVLGKYDLVGNAAAQYSSGFKGFICRSSSAVAGGSILAEVWKNGVPTRITNLADCQLANSTLVGGVSTPTTATGVWQAENQGACTTCHDVHQSLFDPAATEPLKRECTTCHVEKAGAGNDYAALTAVTMMHPAGPGTPRRNEATAPSSPCESCHMPKATDSGFPMHLWRINSSGSYSTFPTASEFSIATGGTGTFMVAKTSPETYGGGSTYNDAVWVDLDLSCGQCHGATGNAHLLSRNPWALPAYAAVMHTNPTGTITTVCLDCHGAGTHSNIVPGFGPGKNHHGAVPGETADCMSSCHTRPGTLPNATQAFCLSCHQNYPTPDSITWAKMQHTKVGGGVPTLCTDCHLAGGFVPTRVQACATTCHGGSGAARAGVPYFDQAALDAAFPQGLHTVPLPAPTANFTWGNSATTSYQVNFNAGASTCPSGSCTYAWNFGDAGTGTGITTSHVYSGATPTYTATLVVTDVTYTTSASIIKTVSPVLVNHAPVAAGLMTGTTSTNPFIVTNAGNTVSFTDASTDVDTNLDRIIVNWGDGVSETQAPGTVFSHNYTRAAKFAIIQTAWDTGGLRTAAKAYVQIVPQKFVVSGTVRVNGLPASGVYVYLKYNGRTKAGVPTTTGSPNYTFPAQLPGSYTMTLYKAGCSFTDPGVINLTGNMTVDVTGTCP
jgi:predicted CXXCH cytochrome family protein